ncbi:MAG: hypothetical protein KGZ81_15995, partial [Flavobacteriales bacterium]|nr:hypothetical protein [Flavobacteriales bacterium]
VSCNPKEQTTVQKLTNRQTKKSQPAKWHIWFFPTHEPTLKKPKEPFFCQRSDTVPTEKLILTD